MKNFYTVKYLLLILTFAVMGLKSWGQIAQLELGMTSYTTNTTGAVTFTSADPNLASLPATSLTSAQQGQAGGTGYISSQKWSTNSTVDQTMYYQFTLTASPGYSIAVTQVSFRLYRSSAGPASVQLSSDADSYASALGTMSLASATYTTFTASGITISGKSSVTFRLYGYAASGTGTLRIGDGAVSSPDITVTGTVSPSAATDYFWNGGNTTNNTTGNNWDNGTSKNWAATNTGTFSTGNGLVWPTSGSYNANFNNTVTGAQTVNLPATLTLQPSKTVIGTSGYSFVPAVTQTFSSPITLSNSLTVAPATGTTFTMSGILSSTGGLIQNGAGTTILSGSNTYSGNSTITSGTLSISSAGNLGTGNVSLNGGTLGVSSTLSSSAAIGVNASSSINTAAGATLTSSGVVSGSNPLLLVGSGSSSTTGGGLTLSGTTNTYSGTITVGDANGDGNGAGVLTVSAAGNLSNNAITIEPNSQIIIPAASTVTFNPTGLLTLNGIGTFTNSGALRSATPGTGASWSGPVTIGSGGATISVTSAATNIFTFSGLCTFTGLLSKQGGGTLTLSGASNTGTGGTTIGNGVITVSTANAMSQGSLAMSQTSTNATFLNINANQTINSLSSSFTATTGTIVQTITIASGATLTDNQTTSTTYGAGVVPTSSSTVTGAGNVALTGSGTLLLSSANNYTGTTTISGGGILQMGVQNALSATAVTLSSGTFSTGATTGFSQTVGTLLLTNNSTIALGSGNHTITFAASNGVAWTTGKTLTITGWTGTAGSSGTTGKISVGSNASGLTATQLAQITFSGYSGTATQLSTGEVVPGMPSIIPSPTTLSGFTYLQGSGPSASQSFTITAGNLTAGGGTITINGSTDYEVSSNNSTFGASATLAYTGTGTLASNTIYVRLKAGLSSGNYNAETISISGGGASASVTASGNVTGASTITPSPASLTGFTYVQGSGPSASQSFTISASNLTAGGGTITVTGSTDYEVSNDNSTFGMSTTLTYTGSGTLTSNTVYVRLKAGLGAGSYNTETIAISGGGGSSSEIVSGSVTPPPAIVPSPASLSGFAYVQGSGPSASQSFTISSNNLTAGGGVITITGSADYEVSTTSSTAGFGTTVTLTYTGTGTLSSNTIYVRLKSGLSAGSYNSETISISGGGATSSVTVSGSVTPPPAIIPTPATLSGFSYIQGSATSTSQSFTISASNLTAGGGTITITGSPDYEVSTTSGTTGFGNTATLTYTGTGTLSSNTVYVRLKTGLTVGAYNSETIAISGGGASSSVSVSGTVNPPYFYWNGPTTTGAGPSTGGTGTWNTTTTNWINPSDNSSGTSSAYVSGTNSIAYFNGSPGTVSIAGSETFGQANFNTSGYILTPSATTTLTGPVVLASGVSLQVPVDNSTTTSTTLSFAGNVSGSGNLIIRSNGTTATNAARINLASTGATISVPISITAGSVSNDPIAGVVATATLTSITSNITNNTGTGGVWTNLGATSGNSLNFSGVLSGTSSLLFGAGASGGAGTVTLSGNNTYTGTTYFNASASGTVKLGIANALPTGTDLVFGVTGTNVNGGILDLNSFSQTIGNLLTSDGVTGSGITNSGSSNSTLTITQANATSQTFALPITDGTTNKIIIVKNGTGNLILTGTSTYTGGTTLNQGAITLGKSNILANTGAFILNGGTFGTGITTGFSDTVGTLSLTDNSTIALGTGSHSIVFAASNGVSWTSGKTLTITGWTGGAGATGTGGKIFVGTNTTGLTAPQLAQISFAGYTPGTATQLATGEIVPTACTSPIISGQPTAATYCQNATATALSVTATGTGTLSYQWYSNTSNNTTGGTPVGTNANTYTPSTTTAGTLYYYVLVSGTCGTTTSTTAIVTVTAAPSATISYSGSPYCSSGGTATVTMSGTTGGTYSSTTGLVIDGPSGDVNLSSSTAGTYTVTYTVAAAGGCAVYTTTTSITIAAAASATINYYGSPYCPGTGTASVTQTGTTGGTYTSTTGLSINSTTGAVDLSLSTSGTYTVTYSVSPATGCSGVYTTTALLTIGVDTWTGVTSTDWNDGTNWSCGHVPSINSDAVIPAGGGYYPSVSTAGPAATVHNLTINSGASLTVTSQTLQVSDSINNSGTFDVSIGTLELNGRNPQFIPAGAFTGNKIRNLVISNNVSLNGTDSLTGNLSFGASLDTFSTNGNLTLRSTASRTGSVGIIANGNAISGNVTVERYIATGPGTLPSDHAKSWELLAVPTMGQTINQSWMEGATASNVALQGAGASNPKPGYGTMITSNVANAATFPTPGFDAYTAPGPTVKAYNYATNSYTGPATTGAAVYDQRGWFTFVRGDRSVYTASGAGSTADHTILRTTGTLITPAVSQPVSTVPAGYFQSVGNPFASPVDMTKISATGGMINQYIYVWDPRVGGSYNYGAFVTLQYDGTNYEVQTNGGYSYPANGTVYNYIQNGQAFFMYANAANGDGTVTFPETAKVPDTTFITPFTRQGDGGTVNSLPGTGARVTGTQTPSIRTSLNTVNADGSTGSVVDQVLNQYDDSYSNSVDGYDGRKAANTGENLSINTTGTLLVVEKRHTIVGNDTIFLNLTSERVQAYQFNISAGNLSTVDSGFIIDNYLNTRRQLNLKGNTKINFNVVNVAGSYAANRFELVFVALKVLPSTIASVRAYQQSRGSTNINVDWSVSNEHGIQKYVVERSADSVTFTKLTVSKPTANDGSDVSYSVTDSKPLSGTNYYRIKMVDTLGNITYSVIVSVNIGAVKNNIEIYPNPVTDGKIHLQFSNEKAGKYGIRLLDKSGQVISEKQITRQEGNSTELLEWNYSIAHGIYKVEITRPDGSTKNINVLY